VGKRGYAFAAIAGERCILGVWQSESVHEGFGKTLSECGIEWSKRISVIYMEV